MGIIQMSTKKIKQVKVMEQLKAGVITQKVGAKKLGFSLRHTQRKLAFYIKNGEISLTHGNRGRPSNRALPTEKKASIMKIVRERYMGFGPTFAAEKLEEEFGIVIDRKTLERHMSKEGLWIRKPKKIKDHRSWRAPKQYFGEMAQLDGSRHKWISGSDEYWTLIKFVDDATNTILFMKFYKSESTKNVMNATIKCFLKHGKPKSIYADRGSIYKVNINNEENICLTQFGRALFEYEVILIHARSPQAKGRIERSFGVDQNRLVKELKLVGIKTMEEANKFLEEYYIPKMNKKFARVASKKGNLHERVSKKELYEIFCFKAPRVVYNDWTILYNKRFFQITASRPAIVKPKDIVTVCEHLNGKIEIKIRTSKIEFKELTERKKMEKAKKPIAPPKQYKPSKKHPWRRYNVFIKENTTFLLSK